MVERVSGELQGLSVHWFLQLFKVLTDFGKERGLGINDLPGLLDGHEHPGFIAV